MLKSRLSPEEIAAALKMAGKFEKQAEHCTIEKWFALPFCIMVVSSLYSLYSGQTAIEESSREKFTPEQIAIVDQVERELLWKSASVLGVFAVVLSITQAISRWNEDKKNRLFAALLHRFVAMQEEKQELDHENEKDV